ncbi:hypothetical protein [Sinomonas halotolerans]|uniref:Cell division protein FtsL n=1 Tax=Sinomonas halotolerans TaxID=1644133 RepID=A0ABU9X393_9MICC
MSPAAQPTRAISGTSALAAALPGRDRTPAPARRAPLALVRTSPVRRRAPFAIFCLGVLAAALVGVLVLNISVSTGQYELVQLRSEQLTLQKQNQDLTQRAQNHEAPQNLAARAAELGMVASTSKGQIDLATLAVTGKAKAAEKAAPQGAVIAAPAIPGQIDPVPAPITGEPLMARAEASPGPAPAPTQKKETRKTETEALNGGSIPAPAQRTPGE